MNIYYEEAVDLEKLLMNTSFKKRMQEQYLNTGEIYQRSDRRATIHNITDGAPSICS